MSSIEKLNNVQHAQLRVIREFGADYGDNVMFVPVYPNEFRGLQSCYPLLFFKDAQSGDLHPIALLGFEEGENLFLQDGNWDAPYIPLMMQRGPLMIGFESKDGGDKPTPVVAVDMAHAKVSTTEGEPLFSEHGGYSDYLDRLTAIMEAIHEGHALADTLSQTLVSLDLITSCDLEITLDTGAKHQLAGFYMINDEALLALDNTGLQRLSEQGLLAATFLMFASQSQLQSLIRRKTGGI
ncbi:SapC family protein [Luminiphilus sp. nBUS_07]|uniref:SapC family protein n=1 Tax=Luminiphilus sp. nBUS_07 TaxID=3395314 RepID=UPI002A5BAFCA|nr:SapC family protein [Luminiphilus sp.]